MLEAEILHCNNLNKDVDIPIAQSIDWNILV